MILQDAHDLLSSVLVPDLARPPLVNVHSAKPHFRLPAAPVQSLAGQEEVRVDLCPLMESECLPQVVLRQLDACLHGGCGNLSCLEVI